MIYLLFKQNLYNHIIHILNIYAFLKEKIIK